MDSTQKNSDLCQERLFNQIQSIEWKAYLPDF